jgi:hypothetical protein
VNVPDSWPGSDQRIRLRREAIYRAIRLLSFPALLRFPARPVAGRFDGLGPPFARLFALGRVGDGVVVVALDRAPGSRRRFSSASFGGFRALRRLFSAGRLNGD